MKNYERELPGRWLFKVVPIFIGGVALLMILYFLFLGTIAATIYTEVNQHGLKSFVERIWEGPKK